MPDPDYNDQIEKYEYISGQHGGYYRHDFIDHAYLYNLYFPPEKVFTCFKNQIHDPVLNYPVAQDVLASLVGKLINQKPEHIVVGNGAAELIKIVSGQIAKKIIVPVPSFNEYVNAAPKGSAIEFALENPSFQLDVDKFAKAVRQGVHIWNINGFAEEFLRILPDYRDAFIKSCDQVKKDRDKLYKELSTFSDLTVYKPDANFIFCRLPDKGLNAPELTKKLFIEHNMYTKHCQGKTMPDADRYIRIAARTKEENTNLVDAIKSIMGDINKIERT
ncbi:MAG: aminotransferase class I/II-fold pyridoxal phosphate-dependent enzyme [Pseudomonadota bacterium]